MDRFQRISKKFTGIMGNSASAVPNKAFGSMRKDGEVTAVHMPRDGGAVETQVLAMIIACRVRKGPKCNTTYR